MRRLLKKLTPRKKWKRVCVYLFSGLLVLIAADMILVQCWRPIDISYETTRITTPLTVDGCPDYIAARNAAVSQGVTADNNAAPALLKIIGTDKFPESWRENTLPQLGLSSTGTPGLVMNYYGWLKARTPATSPAADLLDDEERNIRQLPWKSTDYPQRTQWLNEQHEGLSLLRLALKKDRFYIPWTGTSDPAFTGSTIKMLLPGLGGYRVCSQILLSDAMRAIGDGDVPTFEQDVVDSQRLARLVSQGSTLIEYLVSVAIDTPTLQVIQRAAATPRFLHTVDAQRLLKEMDALRPLPNAARVMDEGERYFMLDSFCYAAAYGVDRYMRRVVENPNELGFNPVARLLIPIHYNAELRSANHYYDGMVAALRLSAHKDRTAAEELLGKRIAEIRSHSLIGITDALVLAIFSSVGTTEKQHEINRINLSLARLSLALVAYRDDHGAYPAALSELTPSLLPTLPEDEFADAPFHYHRSGGGYILYSVGPDGTDDGGLERKPGSQGNWDIVVTAVE